MLKLLSIQISLLISLFYFNSAHAVVNGVTVQSGEHKAIGSLAFKQNKPSCTLVYIGHNTALTAAHCVLQSEDSSSGNHKKYIFPENTVEVINEKTGQKFSVFENPYGLYGSFESASYLIEKVLIHHTLENKKTYPNHEYTKRDLAIVTFVISPDDIEPLKISTEPAQFDDPIEVVGFGFNDVDGYSRPGITMNFKPSINPINPKDSIAPIKPLNQDDISKVPETGLSFNLSLDLSKVERKYSGASIKRKGFNKIEGIYNGVISFTGRTYKKMTPDNEHDQSDGENVSALPGDSGGPILKGHTLIGIASNVSINDKKFGIPKGKDRDSYSTGNRYVELSSDLSLSFLRGASETFAEVDINFSTH